MLLQVAAFPFWLGARVPCRFQDPYWFAACACSATAGITGYICDHCRYGSSRTDLKSLILVLFNLVSTRGLHNAGFCYCRILRYALPGDASPYDYAVVGRSPMNVLAALVFNDENVR